MFFVRTKGAAGGLWAAAFALFLTLFPAGAKGYVLQGEHILEICVKKISVAKRFSVRQRVTAGEPGADGDPAAYDQIARYSVPGRFRADGGAGDTREVRLETPDGSVWGAGGTMLREPLDGFFRYKDLFLFSDRTRLAQRLRHLGVDTSVSSLGREGGRPAHVIGARYPDPSPQQVWFHKETLLPLRWIFPGGEIRYEGWRKWGRMWYPGEITMLREGRTVRSIRTGELIPNDKFAEALFDPAGLVGAGGPGGTDAPDSGENR